MRLRARKVALAGLVAVAVPLVAGAEADQKKGASALLPGGGDAVELALVAPEDPQHGGSVIEVLLQVTGARDLAAFEVDVVLDTALAEIVGVEVGPFLTAASSCEQRKERHAVILGPEPHSHGVSVGAFTYGEVPGVEGRGVLAILRVRPLGRSGATQLHLTRALVSDTKGNLTSPDTRGSVLTVIAPAGKL